MARRKKVLKVPSRLEVLEAKVLELCGTLREATGHANGLLDKLADERAAWISGPRDVGYLIGGLDVDGAPFVWGSCAMVAPGLSYRFIETFQREIRDATVSVYGPCNLRSVTSGAVYNSHFGEAKMCRVPILNVGTTLTVEIRCHSREPVSRSPNW